ncbi:DHHC palmitoyltransferase-domain-containing protein, partial [Vararia minispora EC-137]
GWYVSVLEIGVGWMWRRQRRYTAAAVYAAMVSVLILLIARTHLYLCTGQATHSVPNYPQPAIVGIDVPYESLNDGSLATCTKGKCNGRWKPPTTHHCSTCGVCRVGFDHHCPWLGNCVSTERMKTFLLLLYLTPATVPLVIFPIRHELLEHVHAALAASRADPHLCQMWWDKWYSWVFFGGPPGRWIVGTILGFRSLDRSTPSDAMWAWLDGSLIARPHLGVSLLAAASSLLGGFALTMAIVTTCGVLQGQTALDTIRVLTMGHSTGRFITLPSRGTLPNGASSAVDILPSGTASVGVAGKYTFAVLSGERLYDLGWRKNWARIWRSPWFPPTTSHAGCVYHLAP